MPAKATLSTKGQIVLPKEIRTRHGWGAGTVLELTDLGDRIVLQAVGEAPRTTVDDLIGCLPYAGPKRTLEDMEAAIARGARADR